MTDIVETADLFLNGDGSGIGGRDLIRKMAAEIKRLRAERDQLLEQIALRQPSAVERDMQEVMRINNELKAQLERANDPTWPRRHVQQTQKSPPPEGAG